MTLDKDRLRPDVAIVARQGVLGTGLDREYVILDPGPGMYYGLNEVGTEIWQFIQQPRRLAEIEEHVCARFEVAPEQCGTDLRNLIADLHGRGLIDIVDPA